MLLARDGRDALDSRRITRYRVASTIYKSHTHTQPTGKHIGNIAIFCFEREKKRKTFLGEKQKIKGNCWALFAECHSSGTDSH